MSWLSLGTVTLNYDWQTLAVPKLGFRTFRIIQENRQFPSTKAVIAQSFGDKLQIYYPKGFYFSKVPKVYRFFTPDEFIEENSARFIAIKLSTYSRVTNFNWRVTVEALDLEFVTDLDGVISQLEDIRNSVDNNARQLGEMQYTLNKIEIALKNESQSWGNY